MSHYYFHIRSAEGTALDQEGVDLLDLNSARACALSSARELLADAIKAGTDPVLESVVVTDASGTELTAVPVADALPSRLRGPAS